MQQIWNMEQWLGGTEAIILYAISLSKAQNTPYSSFGTLTNKVIEITKINCNSDDGAKGCHFLISLQDLHELC